MTPNQWTWLTEELGDLKALLAAQGERLDAMAKAMDETRTNMRSLWASQSDQRERIARLETKAGLLGAVGGALCAGALAIGRWLLQK